MASDKDNLNELNQLTADIISRFEDALNNNTMAQLGSSVDNINKSLEYQAKLVSQISIDTTKNAKSAVADVKSQEAKTAAIDEQSKLYGDILSYNDDISENWDKNVKNSATLSKNYKQINDQQKKYLVSLNRQVKTQKKLSDDELKKMKAVAAVQKKTAVESRQQSRQPGGQPGPGGSTSISGSVIKPKEVDPSLGNAGQLLITKFLGKIVSPVTNVLAEIIDTVNSLGDKFEEYAGKADESIRASVSKAGVLMNRDWSKEFETNGTPLSKAEVFAQSMLTASKELNVDEGINFNIEKLAELQQAFTEYGKTNVLLGKDDMKRLAYLKMTFNLAASDVADMMGGFMELGMGSEDVIDYSNTITEESRKFGVNAGKLLKDTNKLMKMGATYRFKGGVKDMAKMQAMAAASKFDIEKAYNVMDQTISIEGAVDLAAQLQTLGGAFSDISSLDLFQAAATGDMEKLKKEIVDRFRQDSGRFGKVEDGQFKMNTVGLLLNDMIKKMGFDLGENVVDIVTQREKEKAIEQKLLSGVNRQNFTSLLAEQQKEVLMNLAQGNVDYLTTTGQNYQTSLINFSRDVLDENAKTMIGAGTARGQMSVKDEAELNKTLVELQSQSITAINALSQGLRDLRPMLIEAGQTIYAVGKETFEQPFYRTMKIYHEYLGIDTTLAMYMNGWMSGEGQLASALIELSRNAVSMANTLGGGIGSLFGGGSEKGSSEWESQSTDPNDNSGQTNREKLMEQLSGDQSGLRLGGLLKAAGGMVMGNSHFSGGVRGMGRFNNVEVEGGEAIINKRSTQQFLPLLSKLNEIGGGEALTDSSYGSSLSDGGSKTIDVRINGKLDYTSNAGIHTLNIVELAKQIQEVTDGKVFDGAY